MPAHRDVDRTDLTDPDGKFAIIRPNSQSGHSPSTRYKTKAKAVEAAKRLCENVEAKRLCENVERPQTFEIVKITARVTTQLTPRVINVR
jgi:uncharacterized protein (DUF362 family)